MKLPENETKVLAEAKALGWKVTVEGDQVVLTAPVGERFYVG